MASRFPLTCHVDPDIPQKFESSPIHCISASSIVLDLYICAQCRFGAQLTPGLVVVVDVDGDEEANGVGCCSRPTG